MDNYYQLRFFIIVALLTITSIVLSAVIIVTMGQQVPQLLHHVHFHKDIAGIQSETQEDFRTYNVIRVVDGDTFMIDYNGVDEKVRLIGIDAPESKDPHSPKECFSQEASEYLSNLIDQKQVRITGDLTQADRDRYGRLLRYAWVDEVFINENLIQEGYAFEYTYNTPYSYQKTFQRAEKIAREEKKGLWGEVCDYNE
jgi:micrococcal nuclease